MFISGFFRVIGLFIDYAFFTFFAFGFNMVMGAIVVRFKENTIRTGRCVFTQFMTYDFSDNGGEIGYVFYSFRIKDGATFVASDYARAAIFRCFFRDVRCFNARTRPFFGEAYACQASRGLLRNCQDVAI